MNKRTIITALLAAMLGLVSCSSEPEWADPEAHEKYADETTLHIQGLYVHDDDGWADYQRGKAEPSF